MDYKWIQVLTEQKRTVQSVIVERYTQLNAVQYVDEIIPSCIRKRFRRYPEMYNINVRILGEEYPNKTFTGKRYL